MRQKGYEATSGVARVKPKALLVGEHNPYGSDPRFALYPDPPRSAGGRLCTVVMGISKRTYPDEFDRVNLVEGTPWDAHEARFRADRIIADQPPVLILLGRKVREAFGLGDAYEVFKRYGSPWGRYIVILPHPSARCRSWNDAGAVDRARAALRSALPDVPFGERVKGNRA